MWCGLLLLAIGPTILFPFHFLLVGVVSFSSFVLVIPSSGYVDNLGSSSGTPECLEFDSKAQNTSH
jgi:hypothetical protein